MKLFTTSVGYADLLDVTLPAWKRYGSVLVITRPGDRDTLNVCEKHDVRPFVSAAWYSNNATLNKGAAQDDAVPRISTVGEPIVMFDADCYPIGDMPQAPPADTLIGCRRFECESQADLDSWIGSPAEPTLRFKEVTTTSYRPGLARGYFQLFRYTEGMTFGRKRDTTFSGCDLWVASQFQHNRFVSVRKFYVLHLGETKVNWKGRVSPQWK